MLLLSSCVIQVFCLKTAEIVFSFPSHMAIACSRSVWIRWCKPYLWNCWTGGSCQLGWIFLVSYTWRDWHNVVRKLFDNRPWNYIQHDNGVNDSTYELGLLFFSDMLTGRIENPLIRKKVINKFLKCPVMWGTGH